MAILQNVFVKAIIVPVLLALAAAILETTVALVRGISKDESKYFAWVEKQNSDGTSRIIRVTDQTFTDLQSRQDVLEIEQMVSFDVANFSTLGLDLVVGAFAVDVASLINATGNTTTVGFVLTGHFLMLIGILLFTVLNQLTSPNDLSTKRVRALISIGLGILAMMLAFFAL